MTDVKAINKQIRKTIIKLFFTIIIFIIALVMWINPNTTIANLISNNPYSEGNVVLEQIKPLSISNISPISDEDAIKNYDNAILKVVNNKNTTSNYELIYRISNNSTLNSKFIKYKLENNNSKIDFLYNSEIKKGDGYTDYILHKGTIKPEDNLEFSFIIWIDENVGNEVQNKKLLSSFVVNSYNDITLN